MQDFFGRPDQDPITVPQQTTAIHASDQKPQQSSCSDEKPDSEVGAKVTNLSLVYLCFHLCCLNNFSRPTLCMTNVQSVLLIIQP